MSDAELEDFVEEMRAAVFEEGGLHEVALGVTDLLPSGPMVHGP